MEARGGLEPPIRALQALAFPLGYRAVQVVPNDFRILALEGFTRASKGTAHQPALQDHARRVPPSFDCGSHEGCRPFSR
jgi:hypothetical protein